MLSRQATFFYEEIDERKLMQAKKSVPSMIRCIAVKVVASMICMALVVHVSSASQLLQSPAPAPSTTLSPWNEVNVLDYGAMGDGVSDDAQAFVRAWRAACSCVNATMLVPRGKTFLVSSIFLVGPCRHNFKWKIDGVVLAPQEMSRWIKFLSWITIARVFEFTVDGAGIIDGQGEVWWAQSCKRNNSYPCTRRPTALTIRASGNITIQNLKFVNSPQMHLAVEECINVTIRELQIVAPHNSPNTDGIHMHLSKNISVEKSVIGTGDDCISIGTNCSDIVIRGVICGPGHGISVGSLGRNNSTEYVSNVMVEDSILANTMYGLRIKTWQGGQGFASNFRYYNVVMLNVSQPIIIDQYYCDGKSSFSCGTQVDAVKVSNVSYANIMGTSATNVAMRFQCSQNEPCDNVLLENVFIHLANGSIPSSFCLNAFGQNRGLVVPNSCLV